MTVKVTWEHTVVGGKIAPEDFLARDETGRSIGPDYRHHFGKWLWAFQAHGPDIKWPINSPTMGTTETKQDAADMVRQVFESCLRR